MKFKAFTTYRQLEAVDCGPTCLKMIFKYYGRQVNLASIKQASQLGAQGISLLGMSEAAEKYGFRTLSSRLTLDQIIEEVPLPCILYWNQSHFVVLTPSVNKKNLVIADPAKGTIKLPRQEFQKKWTGSVDDSKTGIALLLTPREAFYKTEDEDDSSANWGMLLNYCLKYKSQLVQLFLSLLIGSILSLIFPYLTQSIVDTGISTHNLNFIQIVLIAQFALFFGQSVVEFIRSRTLQYVSTHINLAILSDFWIKLMRLPLSYYERKHTGDIMQRIADHKRIETFITGTSLQTIFSVLNIVVFSIVLFLYNSEVLLVFLIGSVLYFILIRLFLKYRRVLDYNRFSLLSKENSTTMQFIHGMNEIKLNNAEQLKRWEWENLQASLFKLTYKSLSLNQYQQAIALFINQGKNIVITYLVATSVLDGHLTLGAMLAIQYIVGQLNAPIEQLINFTQQAQDAKISLERLNEIHNLEEEEPKGRVFINSISEDHTIRLKNLSFTYPGAGNLPVLSNINAEFQSGKITAIVGTSGSGKTTILKLLQNFYDTYSGDILIGNSNLKYLRPHYWRRRTGSVMQDGYIFSDTIEKNITIGDDHIDYDRLLKACQVANILAYVESLPMRFQTQIGAEGIGLSSGQKQRILIARTIYKNPEFVIFDEATNSLDANNELAIMENLGQFFKGRTVIVVAHRLSTVKNADKIIVLENGRIIEEGNHKDLIQNKMKYYELVKNQLELGS